MKARRSTFVFALAASIAMAAGSDPDWASSYNIVWDTPSASSVDSMPLAGGILGLNAWVQDGEVCFLIGSPNCMDANGMQTKLGLIRLRLDPAPFAAGFRQELDLARSEIVIAGTGTGAHPVTVRLWCGVEQPVVHAEVNAPEPVAITARYETWADYAATYVDGGIQWMRRLPADNARRLANLKAQGVADFAASVPDPLSGLTMGGRMTAPGLEPAGTGTGKLNGMNLKTWALRTTKPVTNIDLRINLRMEQDASPEVWAQALAAMPDADREATRAWWRAIWNRSHIFIADCRMPIAEWKSGEEASTSGLRKSEIGNRQSPAWQAGRNYQLFRYLLAANRDGRAMTLFNGGVFPCTGNPDARNWDGCQFMGQNQRLVYWPMLKSGDFDLLKVGLDFYRDRTELRRLHARAFWGVDGVTYPEPLSIFGLDAIGTTKDGRSTPSHLNYHYTSGMEFALMMLRWCSFSGAAAKGWTGPALGIITYYDQYYQKTLKARTGQPLDENGKLVIYPSDACEPYHGCKNNADVIAGLAILARELLALSPAVLPADQAAYLKGFQQRLPAFPMKEMNGKKYFAAAESWEWVFSNGNMDFPQMYLCFPFDHLFLGRSDMSLARNTWDLSAVNPAVQHQNQCWYQSAINLARMGDTAQAAKYTLAKLLHGGARFPVFYRTYYAGGNRDFCHLPDHDHGGTGMLALQEMLMQTDQRRILLGPAWPKEWDCDFKLCAPFQTTVEGRVADGQLTVTKVTPESRRKDIEIYPLKTSVVPVPVSQGKPAKASSVWHQAGYDPAKAFDGDSVTRWAVANGQRSGWLEVDLGTTATIARAAIEEISWPSITQFALEAQKPGGQWSAVATGSTIGAHLDLKFAPVQAQHFRLNIQAATNMPNIEEFQLFAP
jgi:hypothetical protein